METEREDVPKEAETECEDVFKEVETKRKDVLKEVEKKCEDVLNEIERTPIAFSEKTKNIIDKEWKWKYSEKDMVYSKAVENNHRQYGWIYAIMQRYVIDSQIPYKCNELRKKGRDYRGLLTGIEMYYIMDAKITNAKTKYANKADANKTNDDTEKEDVILSLSKQTDGLFIKIKKILNIEDRCGVLQNECLSLEIEQRMKEIYQEEGKKKLMKFIIASLI